ncbi:MAG: PAS domain-containing protein [Hyphomicrobiaceae bacterium]
MKNRASQTLYSYWNEIRRSRIAPHRFEVQPARIADILPDTFILEKDEFGTFRFRLAGTRICEAFGREFRGQNILKLWAPDDEATVQRVLHNAVYEGAVGVLTMDAKSKSGRTVPFEILVLPLIHSGNAISRILGSISIIGPTPGWLGSEPLVIQTISYVSIIWPDGRPHAILQKSDRQPPFSPLPEHKRVVSIERRNFRVFDGGRSESEGSPARPGSPVK